MNWDNTETPTFAGSAGSNKAPSVAEALTLKDRLGNVLATFTKNVAGTFSHDLALGSTGTTQTELDQLNDVSAYQETVIAAGAVSVTKVYTKLALTGAGAVTLAAPSATMLGQIKTIEMTVDNGDVTLALTNVEGGSAATTATFSAITQKLVLLAGVSKWTVLKEFGVALT